MAFLGSFEPTYAAEVDVRPTTFNLKTVNWKSFREITQEAVNSIIASCPFELSSSEDSDSELEGFENEVHDSDVEGSEENELEDPDLDLAKFWTENPHFEE